VEFFTAPEGVKQHREDGELLAGDTFEAIHAVIVHSS
jgi:hypothetical protein